MCVGGGGGGGGGDVCIFNSAASAKNSASRLASAIETPPVGDLLKKCRRSEIYKTTTLVGDLVIFKPWQPGREAVP